MSQAPGDPNPLSLPPPTVCLPWAGFCFGIISSARLQLKKSSLCLSTPSLVFFFFSSSLTVLVTNLARWMLQASA